MRCSKSVCAIFSVSLIVAGLAIISATEGGTLEEPKNLADVAAVIEAHNRERAAEKLSPLTANPKLEAAALVHARDMAAHKKMSHEGSDGSTPVQRIERESYHYRGVAENVAYGARQVAEVVRLWMESPPHKMNILGDFTEVGVACVNSADGTPYWAVEFGKPMPQLDPGRAASDVLDLFNLERKKTNKPPLVISRQLADAAQRHAQDMAAHHGLRSRDDDELTPFDRVERSGYRFKRIGEASLLGPPTPEEAVRDWLKPESSRDSLLGDVREVGIGYGFSEKGVPFWSLIFAEPRR